VDEAAVALAVEKLPATLAEFERPLSAQPYLAGATLSLADLYLVPMIHYLGMTKEGQAILPRYRAIQAWQARMADRPSVQATIPPSFEVLRPAA
jgi:glutathione S-transferase